MQAIKIFTHSKNLPKKLILKSRFCDCEINDGDFDANFRKVMWIGHLCGHVEPLERIPVLSVIADNTFRSLFT